jgi:thiamine phosphate synthase YjbQ (UPF0047 family)
MVVTQELQLHTQGHCDIQDVTSQIAGAVRDSGLQSGTVTIFCPGATGGLTTIEYESGALADLRQYSTRSRRPTGTTAIICAGEMTTATLTSGPPWSVPR